MESKRFSLNEQQVNMMFKQVAKYTAPLLLTFLIAVQTGTPVKEALWVVYGAALQVAINFLSKFVSQTK